MDEFHRPETTEPMEEPLEVCGLVRGIPANFSPRLDEILLVQKVAKGRGPAMGVFVGKPVSMSVNQSQAIEQLLEIEKSFERAGVYVLPFQKGAHGLARAERNPV